jgi:hypothetical protein
LCIICNLCGYDFPYSLWGLSRICPYFEGCSPQNPRQCLTPKIALFRQTFGQQPKVCRQIPGPGKERRFPSLFRPPGPVRHQR